MSNIDSVIQLCETSHDHLAVTVMLSVILSVMTNECLSQLMNVSHTLGFYPNVSDTKPMFIRQSLMN